MYNLIKRYKQSLFLVIKLTIVALCFYFIYGHLFENNTLDGYQFKVIFKTILEKGFLILTLILGLSILNWMLEILKWKLLVSHEAQLSFKEAAQQSLGALTVSLITPNRIGDYAAKTVFYSREKTKTIVALNALGNLTQLFVTLVFGSVGLLYMMTHFNLGNVFKLNYYIISGIALIGFLFYKKGVLISRKAIGFYKALPKNLPLKTLMISLLRFVIFSHQFYIILLLLGLPVTYLPTMMAIFSVYLLASVVPSFALVDWLVKGSVAVVIFGYLQFPVALVLGTSLIMWILNFALPSVIGSVFVLRFNTVAFKPTT